MAKANGFVEENGATETDIKQYKKKISVVIIKNNDRYKETLDSILNQKNFDLSTVEVIIEDGSDTPVSSEELAVYKDKISLFYESIPAAEAAALYNAGLSRVKGEIVNFITGSTYYEAKDALLCGSKSTVGQTVILNTGYFDRETSLRTAYQVQPRMTKSYNLEREPQAIALNLLGYFFHTKLLEGLRFDESYYDECDIKFILDFIRNNTEFYYCHNSFITSYEPFEDNTSKCAIQYKPWWYNQSLENYYNEIKGTNVVPVYYQEAIMYLVYAKINCNLQNRSKGVVLEEEFEEFTERMFRVIACLDDRVILQLEADGEGNSFKHQFRVPRWIKMYLLKNKYRVLGLDIKEHITNNKLFYATYKDDLKIAKTYIANLAQEKVTVYAMNERDNKLRIDCSTTVIDYLDEGNFDIYAAVESGGKTRRIEVERSGIFPLMKIFGKTISKRYRFIIEIDLDEIKYGDSLCVYADYNGKTIKHNYSYASVYSRLSGYINSFWRVGRFLLVNRKDSLFFEKATASKHVKYELAFDFARLREIRGRLFSVYGIKIIILVLFRLLYYVTKPVYKRKHIWMAWDKLYKAGDNGEYMYQYCHKHKKANVYYMVKKDSLDYPRLKKQNPKYVVTFKSFKARFIALHSEVILNTHANIVSYLGFEFMAKPFICGLFNPEVICIQHGLTIQRIAQFQNRVFDNIKLYCCASPVEVQNISDEMYGFSPESIKLTGLARYDGLRSNDQKTILITPTWRRNVVNSNVAHIKKTHNDNFKNSDYFQIYNSLINNRELIDCANATGYKIVYLLHPAMSGQLEDFDKNEYVSIVPATGDINYEKILTESSLMVTDYSGVQFDFAYQRKPLVYYHPDKLPPHYDVGLLDYETMAFGPVCKNEEQIVSELCDYMRNNCVMKDKYRTNADKFFAYDDFGSCERIYNEIMTYLKQIKRI